MFWSILISLDPQHLDYGGSTPGQIPLAFKDQVKEPDSLVAQGIIKPAGDELSDWCHPLVVVSKQDGGRITIDLFKLNKQVSRPAYATCVRSKMNNEHEGGGRCTWDNIMYLCMWET